SRAKHAGALRELNRLDVYYVEAKGGPLVTDTALHESFSSIKSSEKKLDAARAVSMTLAGAFPKDFPDMVLWWQLNDYLSVLERQEGEHDALYAAPAYFLLSMLKMHGTAPELSHCVVCGREVGDLDEYVFSLENGGIIEKGCIRSEEHIIDISPLARGLLRTWRTLSLAEVMEQELSKETRDEVVELVECFSRWHLGERAVARV
ncbi:MAG TPA: DNA repair protein RecO C-terminal domain-containing protein, partial [Candidatus Paceibacterota bacterium]